MNQRCDLFFQLVKEKKCLRQKSENKFWKTIAMFAMGFICFPTHSFGNDYTWPPRENAPLLTLIGPVYEAEIELESELTEILAESLKKLASSPECCLPESYIDALDGIQYLRFVTGYSNDEEWGSIKATPLQKDGIRDSQRVAGILENNEFREPGLELAVRLRYKTSDLSTATLEGYRLILQPNGQAFADWFEELIDTSSSPSEQIMKALVRLLLKPLWQMSEFTVIQRSSSEYLPVQTDAEADLTLLEQCVFSEACPKSTTEYYVFLKDGTLSLFTDSRNHAESLCKSIGLRLISKDVVVLAAQMREYGFYDVMRNINIHGTWIQEEATPLTIDLDVGVDKTTRHYPTTALKRYNKMIEKLEKNDVSIAALTKTRDREVLRKRASLIWCRMHKDLSPRTAMDIYAPDKVGIRPGVAFVYDNGVVELKGKSDKGIKFSYSLSGFKILISTFPDKQYFSFEQLKGQGEIMNPGTPLYLLDGTQLYTVNGVSSEITRYLYTPRRGINSFYAIGWENTIHTLHGNPKNILARRSSPVLEGGVNVTNWLPQWFYEKSLFLEAKAGISTSSGIRIGISLGYQPSKAFRPFNALF